MREYTNEDYFTIENETLESLKMEYSSLSPSEQEIIKELAVNIRDVITQDYGEYISPEEKEKFNNIENRILVVDKDGLKKFSEDWTPKLTNRLNSDVFGKFILIGQFVCLQDMKQEAREIWDENKIYMNEFKDINEEVINAGIQYSLLISTMVHEFVHSTQKEDEERGTKETICLIAMSECGASYLTDKIMRKNYPRVMPFETKDDKERRQLFDQLLNKYGNKTYNIFFNFKPFNQSEEDFNKLKKEIYNEFNSHNLVEIGMLTERQARIYENKS